MRIRPKREVSCRIDIREVTRHRIKSMPRRFVRTAASGVQVTVGMTGDSTGPAVRDQFRRADRVFVGETLELPGIPADSAVAVWLEPPLDMAKPVWGDVMEWVQLGPDERTACRRELAPASSHTERVWGRIAAKECARRLWMEQGSGAVFPGDLTVTPDNRGRPSITSLLDPGRDDMPALSIAHTEGVAVAMGQRTRSRVGIDVETIVEREPGFSVCVPNSERRNCSPSPADGPERANGSRIWCAGRAVAKATGTAWRRPSAWRVEPWRSGDRRNHDALRSRAARDLSEWSVEPVTAADSATWHRCLGMDAGRKVETMTSARDPRSSRISPGSWPIFKAANTEPMG